MACFPYRFLRTEMHSDGIRHRLLEDFHYQTDALPKDYGYMTGGLRIDTLGQLWIDVPPGFVTDFTSSPRWIWALVPPIGPDNPAALIHDFLYHMHPAGRPWADAVYQEAMGVLGLGLVARKLRYWGVRVGGRKAWDDDAAGDKGW